MDTVDRRVDVPGWYIIYSDVQWHSCVKSWYHSISVNDLLKTYSRESKDGSSSSVCRNSSQLVVAVFLNGTVRVSASSSDNVRPSRTLFRTVFQRIG